MNIKNKFLIIFTWFLLFNITNAIDSNIADISKINYKWNLNNDTIIEISWVNFKNCKNYKINSNELKIHTLEEKKITYIFWKNNELNWNISFICNNEIASSNFSFPYLKKINLDNIKIDWKIKFIGENLLQSSSILFETWEKASIFDTASTYIIWKIPDWLKSNKAYVTNKWLKSNIIDIDLKIPNIDYIYTNEAFKVWKKIYIHWLNLNSYKNSYINFWNIKISNYKLDKDWSIFFEIPKSKWKIEVSINSNWITSNKIEIEIITENPYIKDIYIKWEYRDNSFYNDDSEYIKWEIIYYESLVVKWNNFSTSLTDIKLIHNWKKINLQNSKNDEITIDWLELELWNNYFTILSDWIESNTINIYNKEPKPYISNITNEWIDNNKRKLNIWVWNFNIEKNILYYNNSKVTPETCNSSRCIVYINNNTLKWEFSVWLWNSYKTIPTEFNIIEDSIPVINNIIFYWELKPGTKFKIIWENFLNSEIKFSNLVSQNSNWRYNIETSYNSIKWSLKNDYKINYNSDIKISKFWHLTKLSFKWEDIDWNNINWESYIINILTKNNDFLLKPGELITIKWKWFHNDDIINIWTLKTPIIYSKNNLSYFIVPTEIIEWEYNVKIENIHWKYSNSHKVYVNNSNQESEISISSNNDTNENYYTNTKYNKEKIYSLLVSNRINNYIIQNINFKFNNIDKKYDLWTYQLQIDWKIVWESIVDNKWYLNFKDIPLNKSFKKINLWLIKPTPFIKKGKYQLSLENINLTIKWTNTKFSNINIDKVTKTNINIYDKVLIKCYDSSKDNSNCNRYSSWVSNNITNNTEENSELPKINTEEKPKENTNKLDSIYIKIDWIVSTIIQNNSNISSLGQLIFYRNLKFKTNKLLLKYNNHKYKDLLEYYYDKINEEYKKAFKNYLLSKK